MNGQKITQPPVPPLLPPRREAVREVHVARTERSLEGHIQERPSGQLLGEFLGEAQNLIRREVDLARSELREAGELARGAGLSFGIGAMCLFVGVLLAATTIVLLLALALPAWAAAAITFALFALAGGVMTLEALQRIKAIRNAPRATVDTLRDDARWFEHTLEMVRAQRKVQTRPS